jgi:hypothetical protein
MGSLILPPFGTVYADAQIFIDSVEKHPTYAPVLRPLWEAVARGDLEVVSSELTLLVGNKWVMGNKWITNQEADRFLTPGMDSRAKLQVRTTLPVALADHGESLLQRRR